MKSLSFRTFGNLLRLAEKAKVAREDDTRTITEKLAASQKRTESIVAGTYEDSSPKRDLFLFLESLSDIQKKEVAALFYLGRLATDDFDDSVERPSIAVDQIPYHLSDKTDLLPSLIKGLKRLSEIPEKKK